tara:strand:- start:31 stop:600 length:570 start_codon:yes stop_codon:yes gene_type:complete
MSRRVFVLTAVIAALSSLLTLHAAAQQVPESSAASEVLYIELQSTIEKYETSSNTVRLEMEAIRIARHSAESLFDESKVLLEEASAAAALSPPDLKLSTLKKKQAVKKSELANQRNQDHENKERKFRKILTLETNAEEIAMQLDEEIHALVKQEEYETAVTLSTQLEKIRKLLERLRKSEVYQVIAARK